MNDEQKLYPQLIYRINSKLSELKIASGIVKDADEKDEQIIAPSVFNPYGRNFHWLVVAGNKWEFSESSNKWFDNIKEHLQNNKEKWQDFKKKKYATTEDKIEIKSIEKAFEILDKTAYNENDNEKEKKEKRDKFHHALLTVFQFYPVASHKYIDGIIYRNLIRPADGRSDKASSSPKIHYAIANLLIFDESKELYKDTYKLYPWAEVRFYKSISDADPETKRSCQEDNSPWYPELPDIEPNGVLPIIKDKEYYESNRRDQFEDKEKFLLTPADETKDSFYYNYFLPFFAGYEDFKTEAFLELKSEYFDQFKHIIIAPLYDAYIDGKYYGNLCGTLQIPFKEKDERKLEQFKNNNLDKLTSNSHLLTNEIKESAIFEVLQQPISAETDLLEHFIKYITLVQDWERIMVWKKNGTSVELDYCYKRDNDNKWDRCNPDRNNGTVEKCNACKLENGESYFNDLKNWINGDQTTEKYFEKKNVKKKAFLENIFSTKLIPELYQEDEKKYKNTRLIFEHPCYTVFPENEKGDHKLGLHYERQQIDILRQMAMQLKVKRETIKHGTKSAILSIDVRNLSHNIGSHVLAYWLQELKKLAEKEGSSSYDLKKAVNKSIALFRYIQHRADFLAEVATSVPCSEMQFDIKKDILSPFLGDPPSTYIKKNDLAIIESEDGLLLDNNVYVLLQYIAESEGISINYHAENKTAKNISYEIDQSLKEDGKEKPVYVSIPSGIIGKHAIYSILENFIRNAAKHYKGTGTTANGDFIKIKISEWDADYVAIEIIDVRANSCNCDIVKNLNDFINGSFVKEDGSLKSGGWGIKEMLISANFLRKNTPEYLYDVITGNKTCDPPLLEIICKSNIKQEACDNKNCCKECNTGNNLAIRFYLKKPKHLAIMVDSVITENIDKKVFEINKIKEDDFKGKSIPHNILLVDKETYSNKYKDKDNPIAPCRVMSYDEAIGKGKDKIIDNNCYLCLYKKFIKDEIWRNTNKPLPKIVNDLDVDYKFEMVDGYALKTYKNANRTNAAANIVFKDHPEKDTEDTDFTASEYFQPISGGFSTKAKFNKNKELPDSIRNHFYLELIESALIKVVIVDERISEWADKPSKYNFGDGYKTQREMLAKMKIYVANIEKVNLSDLINKLQKDKLGCSVLNSENGAKDENTAHFFVIHQGILDKLEDKNFMDKIKCRWKVIDSGRGVPEKMDYRFVQISALQTLLENYDKHGLVQTLFSLRKPPKEEQSGN